MLIDFSKLLKDTLLTYKLWTTFVNRKHVTKKFSIRVIIQEQNKTSGQE